MNTFSNGDVFRRKQSHPSTNISHPSRHNRGNGSRHEPLATLPVIRRKSSSSASTSTAVTALTGVRDADPECEIATMDSDAPYMRFSSRYSVSVPRRSEFERTLDESYVSQEQTRKDKGKAADHTCAPQSHSGQRNSMERTDETRRAKQERSERHSYSGPLAHAEFERMKKEVESLKKSLYDSKKTVKKQAKKIEDLKDQLLSETMAKNDKEVRVQAWKSKYDQKDELITSIETSLQCQICMDLLYKPFALSPCGHILCLHCLQEWFRKAPPTNEDIDLDLEDLVDDPHYLLTRSKSCPCCRAVVTHRPVPVFIVKDVIAALVKDNPSRSYRYGQENGGRSPSPYGDEDPWIGLFRSSEDEDVDDSDDDVEFEDAVGWALRAGGFHGGSDYRDDSSSPSGSEDEAESGDESDGSEVYDGIYVPARWEPPGVDVDPDQYDLREEDNQTVLRMLRRGCTYDMIQIYDMKYTHRRGLVAHLHSLDELYVYAEEEPSDADEVKTNRIFLGWNIKVDEADPEGEIFMQWILNDLKVYPERWQLDERVGMPGSFDVKKMVKVEDVEDYDTTDTEVWLLEDID